MPQGRKEERERAYRRCLRLLKKVFLAWRGVRKAKKKARKTLAKWAWREKRSAAFKRNVTKFGPVKAKRIAVYIRKK